MNTAYYDANYLFKLHCGEGGAVEVRAHAATVDVVTCSLYGRAEFASAAFRKVREGTATAAQYHALLAQVHSEKTAGYLEWLPLTDNILDSNTSCN